MMKTRKFYTGVLEPGASIGIHEHTDNSEEVSLCFRPGYSLY